MLAYLKGDEATVAGLIILLCIGSAIVNPNFVSVGTAFDMVRAILVPGILAMGVLIVLSGGGIDVSFTAIAAFAFYSAVKLVMYFGVGDYASVAFLFAAVAGIGLGLINGFLVGTLRLPTLIATLGTLSAFRGLLLVFVGTTVITSLPPGLRSFARSTIVTINAADGARYSLPAAFLVLAAVVVATWVLLTRLTVGRAIYALGGSEVGAERIGFNVSRLRYFIFAASGGLAGIAGLVHASLNRVANPFDLVGLELSVIAAVVLGGASINGGRGTVAGTMLGVILVALISNNLILWGIPSTWQNVAIGSLILLGTAIQVLRNTWSRRT